MRPCALKLLVHEALRERCKRDLVVRALLKEGIRIRMRVTLLPHADAYAEGMRITILPRHSRHLVCRSKRNIWHAAPQASVFVPLYFKARKLGTKTCPPPRLARHLAGVFASIFVLLY
jgi:hypothetical protein